jgi:hypothetical protein
LSLVNRYNHTNKSLKDLEFKMKNKLYNIATGLALLTFCSTSFAASEQFTGTFTTIKDVTISQVPGQEMVINGLFPASGSNCVLITPDNTTTAWPGETLMLIANTATTSTLGPGATNGDMSTGGTGCSSATDGIPGIYEIDGAEGAVVNVTLTNTAIVAGLQFSAVGCAGNYNDAADGDLCEPIIVNSSTPITLASSGDEINSAGQGQPVAGKSRLALGGTIISSIGLTAGSSANVAFDVTVAY